MNVIRQRKFRNPLLYFKTWSLLWTLRVCNGYVSSITSFFGFIHKIRTKLQVLCALRNSEICGKDSNVAFQFAMLLQSDFTVDFFLELCGFFVHLKFLFSISQCSNKHVYTSGWVFLKSITVLNIEQTITWMCKSEENQINRYTFQ